MASKDQGKRQSPVQGQQTPPGKGKGTYSTPASKTESTSENSKKNEAKTNDLSVEGKGILRSLPANIQKQLSKCDPGKTISQNAATFIINESKKSHKFGELEKEVIEKIVKISSPEILEEHKKELKVFKFKDGKEVSIGDLLDKSRKKTVTEVKGSESSDNSEKPKNVTKVKVEVKPNVSPIMSPKSETEGKEQSSREPENEMQPERQKSDFEEKFKARGVELEEKEKELKQKDKELKEKDKKIEEKDNELRKLQKRNQELEDEAKAICKRYDEQVKKLKDDIDEKQNRLGAMEKNLETSYSENKDLEERRMELQSQYQDSVSNLEKANIENKNLDDDLKALQLQNKESEYALKRANRAADNMKENFEDTIRHKDNQFKEILAERDDLRHRFSKLAGDKLTDQNPDIADLSDPNRAMKLSEKFGGLYDDQWTDAFEYLKGGKLKMPVKDAISLLLDVLRKCEEFCKKLKETQMDSLRNVLLHPVQDVSSFGTEPRKHVGGLKEHGRIKTPDQKAMRELRRQIGVSESVLEEVKQVFVLETKAWPDKKSLDGCLTYIQKCAEVCWLMVLHDPPLYMKMDVKPGDTLDPNLYSVYSASGNKIDFLVWPPLFNEKDGGLLSKGTAETTRVVKKP